MSGSNTLLPSVDKVYVKFLIKMYLNYPTDSLVLLMLSEVSDSLYFILTQACIVVLFICMVCTEARWTSLLLAESPSFPQSLVPPFYSVSCTVSQS